jgi:hypothetical protein
MRAVALYRAFLLPCAMQAVFAVSAYAATLPSAPAPPLFSTNPNSPYTAITIKQFVSGCDLDQASCVALVGNVLMDRIQFSPTSHICLPDITYGNAVVPWLKAHPETANMGVEDGVFLALTVIYKCGPPNNY